MNKINHVADRKLRVLLHICCAPCAVYCVEKLSSIHDVTGYFYNPNIHPAREYEFRKDELQRVSAIKGWRVVYGPYELREWTSRMKDYRQDPERGARCSLCFHMRLESTFIYAKTHGFDAVATTLSISPYKVSRQINEEGEQLSARYGLAFIPENFKKNDGFRKGKQIAMSLGIQYQNYCGCAYSLVEKKLRERDRKKALKTLTLNLKQQ